MIDTEDAEYVRDGIPICGSQCVVEYDRRMEQLHAVNQGVVNGHQVVP